MSGNCIALSRRLASLERRVNRRQDRHCLLLCATGADDHTGIFKVEVGNVVHAVERSSGDSWDTFCTRIEHQFVSNAVLTVIRLVPHTATTEEGEDNG